MSADRLFDPAAYATMTPGQKAAYTKRMRGGTSSFRSASTTTTRPAPRRRMAPGMAEIEALAIEKMTEHDLLDKGWRFAWDMATKRGGACNYRTKTISLSKAIFAKPVNQPEALNTILHEIAHALAGSQAKHGWQWKIIARRIGCTGDRCHSMEVDVKPPRYVADCECGSKHPRQIMPKRGRICRITRKPVVWRRATKGDWE